MYRPRPDTDFFETDGVPIKDQLPPPASGGEIGVDRISISSRQSCTSLTSTENGGGGTDTDSDIDMPQRPEFAPSFGAIVDAQLPFGLDEDGAIISSPTVVGENLLSNTSVVNRGNIEVSHSKNVHIGDQTVFNGPVTIKQIMMEKMAAEGKINEAYSSSNGDLEQPQDEKGIQRTAEYTANKTYSKLAQSLPSGLRSRIPAMAATAVFLIIGTIVLVSYLSISLGKKGHLGVGDGDDSRYNIPIDSTIDRDLSASGGSNPNGSLRLVARQEWLAQPPANTLDDLELPVKRIIIAHTATENCTTQAECTFHVRFIQTFHMESRNWDDIGYNFLVGGDGAAYEARGWTKQGAHTRGFNRGSICIAFIGTFIKVVPPQRQLTAARLLIAEGIKLGYLDPNYKVLGHRQLMATESPGEALYSIIKTWPHWSESIEIE